MASKKALVQPSEDAERELLEIIDGTYETVYIRGNKYKIAPLKKGTRILITRILLDNGKSNEPVNPESEKTPNEEETEKEISESDMIKEDKVSAKCAAAYLLNSWWKLFFLGGLVWSIYWRWLYYVKQYTDSDYLMLFSVCKKKAEKQTHAYTMNIILQTAMKVTTMTMTRKEVKRSLQENRLAQLGEQQKNSQA